MMKLLTLMMAILLLQGCADVAMSGAQVVYNRHSITKNLSDQYTTLQAYKALKKDNQLFEASNISIATYHGEVLLAGQAPEAWQRFRAEQLVKQLPDVSEVHNQIDVANPSSSLTRMSDAWITTKVKAKLLASEDLDATQVKVVTENGTVYLMGTVQPSEAQAAVELANDTDGVSRVVKIFKYMRITRT